jgi:hypothetical protein
MKKKLILLTILVIAGIQGSKSVPVGTDLELIPAPRNLGIGINQASQKLTVNGAIALTNLSANPLILESQPTLFVKDSGLFYKSPLHTNPFRIDLIDSSNAILTDPTLINPVIKGVIKFDNSAKIDSFAVNGGIAAYLFNGGLFRGDGSQLNNVKASSVLNNTISSSSIINGNILTTDLANGAITDIKITGPISGSKISGDISLNNISANDRVQSRLFTGAVFNGGIFRGAFTGNGSGLTNISSSSINSLNIDSLNDGKSDLSSVFLGTGSGNNHSGTTYSTGVGIEALKNSSSSSINNTGVGYRALLTNSQGDNNVALGSQSLLNNSTGSFNTALGDNSGSNITSGSNNITLGANIQVPSPSQNNQINIGNLLTGNLPQSNINGIYNGGFLNINGGANIKGILDVDGSIVSKGKILSPNNPWILVHSENFQSSPVGWNSNIISDCGGKKILGGFNIASTNPLNKTFDLTSYPHTHVMIKFNYYSLDSWDSEFGFLKTDGLTTWSSKKLLYIDEDRTIIPNCGSGGTSTSASGKDLVLSGEARIDHTSNSLNLSFESSLNEAPNNESFGIDNLEIWVKSPNLETSLNQQDLINNTNCGPNGFYTVQGLDVSSPGNYGEPNGTGPAKADFSKCLNLLFVETGHSVTRTWNFINPLTTTNVLFKIERRRINTSAGVGFTYWFPTNVSGIPNPLNVTLPNADILINCLFTKTSNTYTCTHSVNPL